MTPENELKRHFTPWRVAIPIVIGLAAAGYFIWRNEGFNSLMNIQWRDGAIWWLLCCAILLFFRVLGYSWRLRVLSSNRFTWKVSFQLTLLWEFASAISPGAIGGTAVALVVLAQEKIKTGVSTAIVLVTSFLDELFFILLVPLVFFGVGRDAIFPYSESLSQAFMLNLFWTGYAILFLWTLLLGIGLLVRPKWISFLITGLFSFTRWKDKAKSWGEDLILASIELKHKPKRFWITGFVATAFSWMSRYALVNCLFMATTPIGDHLLIYARQLVMWVILLVSFTPGASGIAETIFPTFFGDFFSSTQEVVNLGLIWRFISYYPFIIAGLITLYFWTRRLSLR